MIKFAYTAFVGNHKVKSVIAAENETEALSALQRDHKWVLSIAPSQPFLFQPAVLNRDPMIMRFSGALAGMLGSGIPLIEALEIIHRETRQKVMQKAIWGLIVDLRKGRSMHESLSGLALFPSIYTSMVRVGEETGQLREALLQLNAYTRERVAMREKVFSAAYYPLFLLGLSSIVVMVLVFVVMPKFYGMFKSFKADLPLITQVMIGVTHFLSSYAIVFFGAALGLVTTLVQVLQRENGFFAFERFVLSLPGVRDVYGAYLRLGFLTPLKMLLTNKVNLLDALQIIRENSHSVVLRRAMTECALSLKRGKGLAAGLTQRVIFPESTIQMLMIGEQGGQLDSIVTNLEQDMSMRMEETVRRVIVMIEPVMILAIGLVVGLIVMAALLPIFSISTMVK